MGSRWLLAGLMLGVGGASVAAACASVSGLDTGPSGGDASDAPGNDAPDATGDASDALGEGPDVGGDASDAAGDADSGDAGMIFDGNCNCGPGCSVVVASHLYDPGSLAADDNGAYWVNSQGDSVQGVEFGASVHPIAIDGDAGSPSGIALTPTAVLWVDPELVTIFGCARAHCTPSVVVGPGNGINAQTYLAAAGDTLYFGAINLIARCTVTMPPSSCTPASACTAPNVGLLSADPSNASLAWTTSQGNVIDYLLANSQCFAGTQFMSTSASAVHVVGPNVYWLEPPTNGNQRLQVGDESDGGSQTLYAFDPTAPVLDFALDPSTLALYWIRKDGTLWKAPGTSSGVPVLAATGPASMNGHVVVNGSCVLWSVNPGATGNGTVMAAPK